MHSWLPPIPESSGFRTSAPNQTNVEFSARASGPAHAPNQLYLFPEERFSPNGVLKNFREVKLDNGAEVCFIPLAHVRDEIALRMFIKAGSRFETPELGGAAHLLEHLSLQTLLTFPSSRALLYQLGPSSETIAGGTSKEWVEFTWQGPTEQVGTAAAFFKHMFSPNLINDTDVKRERQVVLEEMYEHQLSGHYSVGTLFNRLMFGGGSLGHPVLGTEASLQGLKVQEVLDFRHASYQPANAVFVLAGDINRSVEDEFCAKIAELSNGAGSAVEAAWESATSGQTIQEHGVRDRSFVKIGVPGISAASDDLECLLITNFLVGQSNLSRGLQWVRGTKGLVYSFESAFECYRDTGWFATRAEMNPRSLEKTVATMQKCLLDIGKSGFTSEEHFYATKCLRNFTMKASKVPNSLCSAIGGSRALDLGIISPERSAQRIESITLERLNDFVKGFFTPERLTTAIVTGM